MDFVQDIIIPSYALQTPSYLCVSRLCCMGETNKREVESDR